VLQGLIEQLLGRVNHDRFTDPSLPWRDRIQALALELRSELLAHPGAAHLMLGNPVTGPNAQAVGDTLLSILAGAGLAASDAANAVYLLNVHILGSVAVAAEAEQFRWGLDRLLDGLSRPQ
jgi:hypothetical protein